VRPALATVIAAVGLGACVPALPGSELTGNGGAGQSATGGASGAAGIAGAPAPGGRGGKMASSGVAGTPTGFAGAGPVPGVMPGTCAAEPKPCSSEPACTAPHPIGSLVSSFETACPSVEPIDGRDGAWFVYATGTSTVNPDPSQGFKVSCRGDGDSCFAACIRGTLSGDGTVWPTVGLGFTPRAGEVLYDASAYSGISFNLWATVGPNSTLRLLVPLAADTMVGTGSGTCTTSCYDAYNVPLPFMPNWLRMMIPFSQLRQQGFGMPEAWDPTTVISFQWQVSATNSTTVAGDPFMVCVDQVELLP